MASPRDERLSGADQVLYRGERDSRVRNGLVLFEVLDSVPEWDRLVAVYERAARAVPRMRQKVVFPAVPTTAPRWVIDPDFDLNYHLRRLVLPGAGTHRDLLDVAEHIAVTPLDMSRPLWTATLIEGLDGDRAALAYNLSHALADGHGMMAMFAELYDKERSGPHRALPHEPVPQDLDPTELAVTGVKELPGRTLGLTMSMLQTSVKSLADPLGASRSAAAYAASLKRIGDSFSATPPSPLLVRRGARRRPATIALDLAEMKAAAKAHGGTINDIYLASICAAFRRYHDAKGVPVERIPMGVPISTRKADHGDSGNHFSGIMFAAPIGTTDPAARVAEINHTVRSGRKEPAADFLGALSSVLALLPDALYAAAAGSITGADIQASNIAAYPFETYLAGARIEGTYGLGPVPGIACMFTMVSRAGKAFVCARYDTAAIDDTELFERCLAEGFAETLAAGKPTPAPDPAPAKATAARKRATPRKRAPTSSAS